MAARFWVGGAGTWNTSSTTNWSASSGGPNGASVPTVADSVFFDQAGTYTVTMTGALACLDITVSAGTVTFATGTSPTLNVRGSMTLLAGTVWNSTGSITFSSTTTGRTITTNGTSIAGRIFFNGVGGYWTLGSALTSTNTSDCGLAGGTFDTAGFALTCAGINLSNNTATRAIILNNSTVTLTGSGSAVFLSGGSNTLTFDAGTSQINITAAGNIANDSNSPAITLNFYNVAFTSTAAGTRAIGGTSTFNNLSVTGPASAGVITLTLNAQQTINGTLSTTGTAGNRRVFFTTANYGISHDLVVNSAPSLTDADFRGLYVRGTAAPISGTRIGNRGECRGITFDAPKTVYWNLGGSAQWNANAWAATSGGSPNTDNFPLPQDTAIFDNAGSAGTVSPNAALCNVDLSARTSAFTVSFGAAVDCYGNWTNGSGVSFSGTSILTFSGGTTQTITSAGKTFSCPITINTYGGTVQLADALNLLNALTVTNGTFDTKNYNVTLASGFNTVNSNVRTIKLGSSTVSATTFNASTFTNLTLDAGTSQVSITSSGGFTPPLNSTFYNVTISGTTQITINAGFTCNNLTFAAPSGTGVLPATISFDASIIVNGTFTCAGASAIRRIFVRSSIISRQVTMTVNAISADDCDFRDINLAGAASGASPTRAGDCGGNTGITFPAPKTVYWNLAGAQNWSSTAWASGSGGTPDINNFPLAQDTAVFDNGAVSLVTINAAWNIGTFDASAQTNTMTLTTSSNAPVIYGDWTFGSVITSTSTTGAINFSRNGTQTITSNGVQFGCPVTINHPFANVQLADALSLGATRTFTLLGGMFDAVTYNVTTGLFVNSGGTTVRMGSGTWTLSGTGTVWNVSPTNIFVGTSTVVLSDTSTNARTLNGGGYLNKVTIGGATGISILNINAALAIGELASTKTVAHTITFQSNLTATVGKWSVTGTAGNVVTVNSSTAATAFTLSIAGPANSGIDYLSIRDCTVATTSPGEFYVGANSTNVSNNTRVIFTATPAPRTLYWVGGTGNWSDTARWSTSSGGGSGAAIPTSLDAVNFDSLSNATAYTATIDAGVTLARCASFTMAGPASGNVTFAGSVGIAFHGDVSFAATGITRTYTGAMNWAGNGSYTFTTNGLALASGCVVIGVGSTWTLGSALNNSANNLLVTYGTFSTSVSNYALTVAAFASNNSNIRSIFLNGSAVTINTTLQFITPTNLTFNANTSTISASSTAPSFQGGGQTFNNVSFTNAAATSFSITGSNTFNTMSFAGRTTVGIALVTFSADQTISTLTLNAGTASAYRRFLASDTIGTTRTLTVGTLTAGAADIDFRDITIAGAAAPISGTRFGDAKGNSGITFDAPKTVYWASAFNNPWGVSGAGWWSATNGGAADATQFPLAQDTAFIPFAVPNNNQTITVNANYNIGTIDMNERNGSALVTLSTSINSPQIYGNWINGTGTTLSGTGNMTFAGRGSQTITSAGRTFTQAFTISTPGGSVTLQDAFTASFSGATVISLTSGTFNAATYNVTLPGTGAGTAFNSSGSTTRTIAVGSGTWSFSGAGTVWNAATSTNLTVTGTGTISLTAASAKTFSGGGANYSGITLDQGGAGALTITGNNTFKDITNTYSATGATTINLGATTQTLTSPWTATGEAGRVLTVSGTSAASPGTLIFSGGGQAANVDYLAINNVRAYDLTDTWYAGANSTNGGSLGWYFIAGGGGGNIYFVTITETGTGADSITANVTLLGSVSETGTGTDSFSAGLEYTGDITESGTVTDEVSARFLFLGAISENATGADLTAAIMTALGNISETATGTDTDSALMTAQSSVSETAAGTDADNARLSANSNISETATAADAVSALTALLASVSEAATATDLVSAIKGLFAFIVESASITDALNAPGSTYNPSLSETATGTDSISALALFAAQVAESASITDATAAFKAYLAAILEAASGADSASAAATFQSQVTETSVAQDIVRSFMVAAVQVSETASGMDQVSALRALAAAVVETVSGSDVVSASAVFRGILQEIATLTDSVNAPGSTYSAPVVELATLQDAVRAAATFPTAVIEAATGTEINSAAFTPLVRIIETATITDAASALAAFAARTAESANITDEVSPPGSIYNPVVLAVAQLLDQVSPAGSVYNAPVLESATIADSLIGGFLWNLIDNAENADWGTIDVAQATSWGVIDAAQPADWTVITPVNTTEVSSGWTSSATDGVTAVVLNGLYSTGLVTPYAVSTQNGPWLYRQLTGQNLSNIRYVNGNFYAFSTLTSSPNQLYRSADGFNWVRLQAPDPARPIRAIFGNGTQLIVQQNTTQIYLSTDNGATWATNTIAFAATLAGSAVWDGTKYVYTNGRRIYTSTDGAVWTSRYFAGEISQRSTLAWNGTYFVAVFQGANSNIGADVARSTDGISWTRMYRIGWMAIVFNFGNTFAVALRNGEFYSLDPATNNYNPLGVNTGYIYEPFASADFGVSFYNGEYILPAFNLTAVNQLPASTNLVTFTPEQVSFWGGIDDSQTPNWQNTNTLN